MKSASIAAIQAALFCVIDLLLVNKSWKNRKNTTKQKIFVYYAITVSLLELMTVFQFMEVAEFFQMNLPILYVFNIIKYSLFGLVAFYWFKFYLQILYPGESNTKKYLWIELLPSIIFILYVISSPITHGLFYIEIINGHAVFCVGKHANFQSYLYVYAIAGLLQIIYAIIKHRNHAKEATKYLLLFTIANIIGFITNYLMEIDYGYSQIGISFTALFVYIEMIVEENAEIKHLQKLEEINKRLQESNDEQEAQLEEIKALNLDLEENQTRLEESAAEQEAQLEEITALNTELQEANDRNITALGVIEGLSQEYHTIWHVEWDTMKMIKVRNQGVSYKNEILVDSANDMVDYWETFENYIKNHALQQDYNRLCNELSPQTVTKNIENSKNIYTVNYLHKEADKTVGYHQFAFVNATTEQGKRQFMIGLRDIDSVIKGEIETRTVLADRLAIIQSMSKVYFASFFVNLKNDSFIELSNIEQVRKFIGNKGKAQESLFLMAEQMVAQEFSAELRDFVNLKTIDERLKEKDVITADYIGNTTGWSQLYIIAGTRDANNNLESVFIAARKIHEEKAREEAQQKEILKAKNAAEAANNAKTNFLFSMSHDIRTPMNAIIGFTNLLKKQKNPVIRTDYIKKIEDSSEILLSIINNVLEMSRIEKGTIELTETAWSTDLFIDTIYSVFNDLMEQKHIEYTHNVDVVHPYVFCDIIKIREIYINIISNAYKYTNSGGKVNLELKELPSDKDGYVVYQASISDTGIGMSKEYLPHIFEEFSRESTTTANKIEGTGLGLSIVKRLLDVMGGTISVESEKGKGTTFTITITHRIAQKTDLIEQNQNEITPELFENKRILLAEDNDLNAEIAIAILEDMKFTVERAVDGINCLEMLKNADENYYDIILMDIQMPNMNGYEATQSIRQLENKKKAEIPIVAMTANAFEEDKKEVLRVGMNAHVSKPIDTKELIKILKQIVTG